MTQQRLRWEMQESEDLLQSVACMFKLRTQYPNIQVSLKHNASLMLHIQTCNCLMVLSVSYRLFMTCFSLFFNISYNKQSRKKFTTASHIKIRQVGNIESKKQLP